MNNLEAFNQALFLQLNATAATPTWLIHTAVFTAVYLIYLIPLMLVGMWCWGNVSLRNSVLKVLFVVLIALGINACIGLVWPHPRPFVIGLGHTFLSHAPDPSFPSDHGTIFAAVGLTLVLTTMRSVLGWMTLAIGMCVAWARVFLGVHFPLDMFGAVVVACVGYGVIYLFWRKVGAILTGQAERIYGLVFGWPIARGWIRP